MQKQANVAMCKISTSALTAGILNNTSFMEAVREYVENKKAFTIMNSIKRTLAYWKKFKSEALLTLPYPNLRWDEDLSSSSSL